MMNWKGMLEVIVAYIEVLSQPLPGRTEENCNIS